MERMFEGGVKYSKNFKKLIFIPVTDSVYIYTIYSRHMIYFYLSIFRTKITDDDYKKSKYV